MGTQRVTLSGGTVEDDDTGGSGRTIVLCHRLLMDGSVWDTVMPYLDEGLRVIRPYFRSARIGCRCTPTPTCRCAARLVCCRGSWSASTCTTWCWW